MKELIRFVRQNSPFYRDLYKDLPEQISSLEQLPVLRAAEFWEANTLGSNRLLTGPIRDGILLKSGGTTGKPKFSVFARDEWERFTRTFAQSLPKNGIRAGDRVANLFYVGELYGSFVFTHTVLDASPEPVLQLPIAGSTDPEQVCKLIADFGATVLTGVPTTLLGIVSYLETHPELIPSLSVRMLLFAGEAMYEAQRARVARVLPGAEIRSIGYASTDAGLLGFSDLSCGPNEFRSQDGFSAYEILDEETGAPITVAGKPGLAVVTDLQRRLMPVIRYPVGDRAQWIEPLGTPFRKFLLLGRSEESGRVGPVTLYYEDVLSILQSFGARIGTFLLQLVLVHQGERDGLLIRIGTGVSDREKAQLSEEITRALYHSRPMYQECMEQGKIHPARVEWVDSSAMDVNPRTGKLRRIIDQRLGS